MKLPTVLLFLLLAQHGWSQDSLHTWEDGPLTWERFGSKDDSRPGYAIHYQFSQAPRRHRVADSVFHYMETIAGIDLRASYVAEDLRSLGMLRILQLIAAIVELHRRQLHALYPPSRSIGPPMHMPLKQRECAAMIDAMERETASGMDAAAMAKWEEMVAQELVKTPEHPIPEFRIRRLGYGMNIGAGSAVFTSTLGEQFRPAFLITYGFDLALGRTLLYLQANMGATKLNSPYESGVTYDRGQSLRYAIGEASLGHAIVDGPRWKLAPFAGYTFAEYSFPPYGTESTEKPLLNTAPIAGLVMDLKFRKTVKLAANLLLGGYERTETSVRVRLFVTPGRAHAAATGTVIGLTIGLNGFGNSLRLL